MSQHQLFFLFTSCLCSLPRVSRLSAFFHSQVHKLLRLSVSCVAHPSDSLPMSGTWPGQTCPPPSSGAFGMRPPYSDAHSTALCDGSHMPIWTDTAFAQALLTFCAQDVGIPPGSQGFHGPGPLGLLVLLFLLVNILLIFQGPAWTAWTLAPLYCHSTFFTPSCLPAWHRPPTLPNFGPRDPQWCLNPHVVPSGTSPELQ